MGPHMTTRLVVAIALSLAGGVVAWLGGRQILRRIDDPTAEDTSEPVPA